MRNPWSAALGLLLALLSISAAAAGPDAAGVALLAAECGSCHKQQADGSFERIAEARRTPEGWEMVLGRMTLIHKVELSPEKRQALVKLLAANYGLAPSEARDWRYLLERRADTAERMDDTLIAETCARCHAYARIALQRRSEQDWLRLSHFHVGQYPSIEIQSNGRDRDWWDIASKQLPPLLAKRYPLQSEAWSKWQAQAWNSPAGAYRVVGHRPGWGDYEGQAKVVEAAGGDYGISIELRYADGRTESGSGKAKLYTGYEWRASLRQNDQDVRQVFALGEDGKQLAGRWYIADVDTLGGDLRAVKVGGKAEVLAVTPGYIKSGSQAQLAIHGTGLAGKVDLGPGLAVLREVSRSADSVVVEVKAATSATGGARQVRVGDAATDGLLKVYRRIDYLRVEPERGLARIGGDGGKLAKQPMQFEAVGYVRGKAKKGKGDWKIGVFPAQWSFANANANAKAFEDEKYAGGFAPNGLFVPGDAGPNRKRKYSTNNTGDLKVTAKMVDGKRTLAASAPLIVTVQRWVDPPLR